VKRLINNPLEANGLGISDGLVILTAFLIIFPLKKKQFLYLDWLINPNFYLNLQSNTKVMRNFLGGHFLLL